MSAPFASQLRTRETIRLAGDGQGAITVRVQVPELWDALRFEVAPTQTVQALKLETLDRLAPDSQFPENFVMKLGGWEILDERATLAEVGAVSGSTFLLTSRRRRPVR
jgi:hypothetical protein